MLGPKPQSAVSKKKQVADSVRRELDKYSRGTADLKKKLQRLRSAHHNLSKSLEIHRLMERKLHHDKVDSQQKVQMVQRQHQDFELNVSNSVEKFKGDMLALDNLRDSMDAQLQEVRVNHEKVLHSDAQSEFVSGLAAAVCHASMINTHHVYQRWLRLWPALQVWLANEEAANYSIYGSAKLEGYIEELMSQLEIRSSLQRLTEELRPYTEEQLKATKEFHIEQMHRSRAFDDLHESWQKRFATCALRCQQLSDEIQEKESIRTYLSQISIELAALLQEDLATALSRTEELAARTFKQTMEDYIARVSHQYYISTQPSGKRRSDGHTTRDSLSGTTQSPLGRSQIIGIGLSERDWNESESFEKDDKHSRDAKMFSVGLSMDVFDQSMVEDLTSSENYEQFLGSYYTPRSCATWEWIRKVASSVCSCVEEATLIHPKLVAFREEVPELEVFTASFRGALLVPSPVHLTNLLDGREQHLITKSKYSKYANEIDKYLQTKILQVQSGKRREERLKSILLTPTSSTSSLMSSSSSQPGLHKSSDDQSPRRARANVISRNDPTEALLERQLAGIPKHYIHSPKRENAAGTNKKLEVEYQLQSYLQQSSNNLFLTMSNISLHCGSCSRRALREQQLAASIVSKETISQLSAMLHEALRNETEAPGSQNSNYPPSKKRESIDDEANQKKLTALTKQLTQMFQSSRKNFEQWIAKAITRKWKDACNSLSELHLLLGTDDEEQEDQPPPTEGVQLPSVSAVGRFARASFDSQKDNLLREHDSNRDPKINAETMAAVVRSIKEKKKKLQSAATDLYDEGGEYMVPSLYSGREAERDQKLLIETSRPNFDVVNTGEEVKTKAELEQIEKTLEVSRHLISSIHGNLESYSQWSGFQFSVENDREEGNNQNSSDSDNDHDATGSGNDTYASPSSNNKPSFLGRSHLKKETRSKKRDRQSSVSGGTTSREKGEYKEIEEDSYSAHRPSNYLRKKKQAENENSTSTCGLQEDSADSMQTETTISSDQPSMITAPPKPRMPRVTRYESVTIPEKDKILVTMETIISGELFLVEMHWKPAQSHILIIAKNYLRKTCLKEYHVVVDSQVISEITQTPKHLSINFLFSGSDQRLMGVYTMLINSLRLETIDSIYYKDLIESMMSRRSADDKVRESVDRSSDAGSLGVSETASPDNTSPLSKNSPGRGARKTMSLTDRMNSMAPKLHRQLPYELMVPSIEDFDLEKMLASNTGAASFNAELLEYGKEHSYDQTESSFHDTVANQLSKQGSARIRTISNDIGRDPAIGKLDRGTSFYQPSYQLQYKMQQLQSEQKRRREGIDREFGHFLHVMTMRKKTGELLTYSFAAIIITEEPKEISI